MGKKPSDAAVPLMEVDILFFLPQMITTCQGVF